MTSWLAPIAAMTVLTHLVTALLGVAAATAAMVTLRGVSHDDPSQESSATDASTAAPPHHTLGERLQLATCVDVTPQHHHTQLLQQQVYEERAVRDRLDLATQTAGIGVWHLDVRTNEILADASVCRLLDLDGAFDHRQMLARIHPEDRQTLSDCLDNAIHHGALDEIVPIRHRIVRTDGLIRHLQTHIRVFRDAHSVPDRVLGVTWDVTAEVERATQLQQQTVRTQALLDRLRVSITAAGIAPWELDLRTEKFLWADNRLPGFGFAGVPLEDYSTALVQAMHPEDRKEVIRIVAESVANGTQNFSYRFRLVRPDGTERHLQSYAFVIRDEHGTGVRLLGATTDITNEVQTTAMLQRQAEQERALVERLNMATEVAGITSWETDLLEGRFVWVENPIKGLENSICQDQSLEVLAARMHPVDRVSLADSMRAAVLTRADRLTAYYRATTEDGRLIHIQEHMRLFVNEAGVGTRAVGVSRDATREIEAAEKLERQAAALRDAEHRLERASLSSSEGHWELDFRTARCWFSASYHTLLGYRQGQLPTDARAANNLLQHPDDVERQAEHLRKHIEDNAPYDCECRLRLGNGEYRWFRTRGTVERDANGKPVAMAGSAQDIHQQKLAEDALKLAQRRFERAITGTQDGLWELEADGTAWCSPRLGELLGFAADEFDTSTNFLRMFLHPDDANAVALATQAHFQQGTPYDVDIRLRTRSDTYRWYRTRAIAERDANGRPLRMSGSLQDVTDARAAHEELVRAREAAEAASRAKSEFLANVSHEIRTPMNGIIGMTGLLLDTALDRTQNDYAQTIRGSADSLLIVINDILDFSKIEAGKMSIEYLEMDLRSSVEDVGSMMAFHASTKNLELVMHVHPDLPDCVISDRQRIRQCLINLVGNAIKFTSSGEIVIEVRSVGHRDGKVLTQFEVRDTGIGIAPHVLQTLFQPFVQADSSTTRHFGGTGLGLSIVRRLVEMMGGAVGLESELGKGSIFWFTLPLEPAPSKAVAVEAAAQSRADRRVLIVDDNETNRRMLAGQLMHAGYAVSLAGSGNEALQLLRQGVSDNHHYDIVLADYQMHDMDGATLGERINADAQLSRARIVILASLDRHGDIPRFASLGFAGYLTKPVRSRDLIECLDRLLSRDAKEWHLQSQPIVTSGMLAALEKSRRYRGRILLVEDNAVNQKVAVRFLERMGCTVRVADNGVEGLKAFKDGEFDIVLMDLQMPIMDGLTATRAIRDYETGRTRTPIVALTANAMSGQLERCLEAGMNGFLSKPLEIARLHETLERFGLAVEPSTEALPPATASAAVNLARLHEITDGDAEFMYELACTFIHSGYQILQEIADAHAAVDRPALARAAHKLKGSSANIHADGVRDLAHALEVQAIALDQPRLQELIEQLHREFVSAANLLQENAPSPAAKTG